MGITLNNAEPEKPNKKAAYCSFIINCNFILDISFYFFVLGDWEESPWSSGSALDSVEGQRIDTTLGQVS